MDINQLMSQVKTKIEKNISIQNISIKDKTFLHKKHTSHTEGRFHLEIIVHSNELKKLNKIQATKKIYKIIDREIQDHIHSVQVLINS